MKKNILQWLPKSIYVADRFHLEKQSEEVIIDESVCYKMDEEDADYIIENKDLSEAIIKKAIREAESREAARNSPNSRRL